MKKKIFSAMLVMALALSLCIPVSAATQAEQYVWDMASLLSESAAAQLNKEAEGASEQYGCGIYLVTVPDLSQFSASSDINAAAKEFYLTYDLGKGTEKSGALLFVSMESREYSLIAYGEGNRAFTDYGKDYLADKFLDDFKKDNWQQGFQDYVSTSVEFLEQMAAGTPVDVGYGAKSGRVYGIVACVILALLVSVLVCAGLRFQLRSVAKKTEAAAYIPAGGVNLRKKTDLYTHTTQTRVHEEPPKSSGSGGTSVGSDGFSSKSGNF